MAIATAPPAAITAALGDRYIVRDVAKVHPYLEKRPFLIPC